MGLGFKANGEEEEPESFRSALGQIKDLRASLTEMNFKANAYRISYLNAERANDKARPLLDALRSADPQTLPERLAHLVAAWKAAT